jgi:hypothetical protein
MNSTIEKKLNALDERLRRLLSLLESYSEETLNTPPGLGQWSALQTAHHLSRSEQLSLQYVRKKLSFNPTLPRAGLVAAARNMLLWAYLYTPFKWKAPNNVNESSFPAVSSLPEVSASWWAQRQELREYLAQLPRKWFDREVYRHPFAGRLSLAGMLDFFIGHFDRHEKQIRRALKTAAK